MRTLSAIRDGEEIRLHASGQEWLVAWHGPESAPQGQPHGSAGLCVTPDGGVVLISADGIHWDLPAGRPEGTEDWEATLCREMLEEACAVVRAARLLGFIRGQCIKGHEQGLVLVRAIWRADVELQPWDPKFEIRHRRIVPAAELMSHLAESTYWAIYRRALIEAGLA